MPVNFNGQVLIQPQARTAFNYAGLNPPNPVTPNATVLIGPSNQGPNALSLIQSPADILNILGQNSDGANACWLALNPSGETNGANPLYFWNVNPTTQGTLSLANASAVAQITLTTTRWGAAANLIKVAVSAGSSAGYTVVVADDYSGQAVTLSNVVLNVLSIWYSGTGTSPTVSATDSQLTLVATTSDVGGTITFSSGMTAQQLVNQINTFTGWNATLLDPNPLDNVNALFDNVSDVTVGTTSTTSTTLTANVTAVVRALNGPQQSWVTAVRDASATSLATAGTFTYASGGSTGTPSTADWQAAYTALQAQTDVLWVTPITPESSTWMMNDQHCSYMHSLGYGRSGIVGGDAGTSVSTALTNAALFADQYTSYLVNGYTAPALDGSIQTFPPYVAVAALTAMEAGQPLNESLTLKSLHALGLEQTFAVPTVDQLVQGGCLVLKPFDGLYVVTKGQTTAALDPAATSDQIQMSAVNERFVIEKGMNTVLSAFVGQPITSTTASRVQDAVLHYLASVGQNPGALIFQVPKRSQVVVTISGTVISVTAPASPTLPADFVLALLTVTQDTAVAA